MRIYDRYFNTKSHKKWALYLTEVCWFNAGKVLDAQGVEHIHIYPNR